MPRGQLPLSAPRPPPAQALAGRYVDTSRRPSRQTPAYRLLFFRVRARVPTRCDLGLPGRLLLLLPPALLLLLMLLAHQPLHLEALMLLALDLQQHVGLGTTAAQLVVYLDLGLGPLEPLVPGGIVLPEEGGRLAQLPQTADELLVRELGTWALVNLGR